MTARWQGDHTRGLDERDPAPEPEWREASSPGIRRLALEATAAAVARARDARKKPIGEVES